METHDLAALSTAQMQSISTAAVRGLIASTIFTLFVIPVTYWLFYAGRTDSTRA
jgi:multidrug efflux pump subunit AcrB